MAISTELTERVAQLRMSHAADGSVLTAAVPHDFKGEDLAHLGASIAEIIRRQTGCNCLSGRIKVVIQDDFNEVIKVNLGRAGVAG
jgi:hypothetical protein